MTGARRIIVLLLSASVLALALPAAAAAYWDFQGNLYPSTWPWEYSETNPVGVGAWGIRLSRSNCDAKIVKRRVSDGGLEQFSIPGGCSTSDWSHYYDTSDYDASAAVNKGTSTVWVNVRIDANLGA